MSSLSDMYDRFKKALLDASSTGDNSIPYKPSGEASGIDISKLAQEQANRDLPNSKVTPITKITGSQFVPVNPKVVPIDQNQKKKPNPLLIGK